MNGLLVSGGLGATARRAVFLLCPVCDVAGDVLHGADVDELSLLPVPLLVVVDEGVHLAVDVQDGDGFVQVAVWSGIQYLFSQFCVRLFRYF